MKRKADEVLHYDGPNPFSDNQARNFSDTKITNEFCPTSCFWSLFNDQHEILLGTRGSGKTFLLKMMRRSMLKKIDDPNAQELVRRKEFLALYVPMHLEVVSELKQLEIQTDRQIILFQLLFNCLLAESLVLEIADIVNEEVDELKRIQTILDLSRKLDLAWFDNHADNGKVSSFNDLIEKLRKLYYSFDLVSGDLNKIPPAFKRQICSTLVSVEPIIANFLGGPEEPTWIICVDEAEFLNETLQKCINSVFRSDSNRIALKVATLPFYHKTLETLAPGTVVSMGNDFNYCIVDMKHDSADFKRLTDKLCAHRLKTRLASKEIIIDTLEDFLGKIGNDDLIDYYRAEVGEENATREVIESKIVESFSSTRRKGAPNYSNTRKTVYDKYAPIFFVREMHKRAGTGNSKPGWYAGATTVRKVAQGNPRMFIQIMNGLFEKAKKTKLIPKAQHEVILKYAQDFCAATQALELYGPVAYAELDKIAYFLGEKVHCKMLVSVGCSFRLKYKSDAEFKENLGWLQKAIAYSRLIVSDEALINGLNADTKYLLANTYATTYWIPMRGDITTTISTRGLSSNTYTVSVQQSQISLFEEVT